MKVFSICRNVDFGKLLNEGKPYIVTERYPVFNEQKAQEWLEFLQPHYEEELWIEESEESLQKFAERIYIPEQIKFGDQMCDIMITDDERVKLHICGSWVDITTQLKMDNIGLKYFNDFHRLRNECWKGRNKCIVNECVLREVHMNTTECTFAFYYKFTHNAYLDRRDVIGGTWTIDKDNKAKITQGSYLATIRVSVCW